MIYWKEELLVYNSQQLEVMNSALKRYEQKLLGKQAPKILDERKYVYQVRVRLREAIQSCEDLGSEVRPILSVEDYKFLSDALHKYYAALNQEYQEKFGKQTVEGEFELEEMQLNVLSGILQKKIFVDLGSPNQRRKLLVTDLCLPLSSDTKEMNQQIINQYIDVNYGQVAGQNKGVMNQINDQKTDIILQRLIEKVSKLRELLEKEKSEYIADLEVMRYESLKEKPNKSIFKLKYPTLEKLSHFAQIGSFVLQHVIPTVKGFIEKLPSS